MGLYVYAVGRSGEGETPPLSGVFDQPAYRFDVGSLCAVVSECPVAAVRAERRHIAATQCVLAALSARFDILPMANCALRAASTPCVAATCRRSARTSGDRARGT